MKFALVIAAAVLAVACSPVHIIGNKENEKPTQVLAANFDSIYEVLLKPKCISCHSAGSPSTASRTPLTSLPEILSSPRDLVIPGNPDESGIVIYTKPGATKRMPPPDSGKAPLTDDEIQILEAWILSGAKN